MTGRVGEARWRRYLRFWRSDVRADVDDEFRFHVDERVDELVALGMHPDAARDEAMRRFGSIDTVKSTCRDIAADQESWMRRSQMLDVLKQDAIYSLRLMRSHPGFTAAVVLTLALGIGATTAIFSVVNSVLLRPLPYDDADRIVIISERFQTNRGRASGGHFHDWTEMSRSFSATSAWVWRTFNLTDGDPTRVFGALVTPGFFQVQHMPPAMGRYFLPTENADSRVTVLSYPLWESRYSADPAIVGKTVTINGQAHTVVGVTPPGFNLSTQDERLWTPFSLSPEQSRNYGSHSLLVLAKLKPGVTIEQATADVTRITEDIRRRQPDQMKERGVEIQTLAESLVGTLRNQLWVLLGAVTFVLLIGCGNIASLLLARAMTRRKEIAIRGALGGARNRLVRQLLTESALLAAFGGAVGLFIAHYGIKFLVGLGPNWVPRLAQAGLDLQVLSFAAAATLFCGILFGLMPALRATRVDLQTELRDGGRGSRAVVSDRLRGALIVAEMAGALVLLVSAGLFIRSAMNTQAVPLGFEPKGVTMMRVALPQARYDSAGVVVNTFRRLVSEIRAIPGVESAGAATRIPLWGGSIDMGIEVEGRPKDPNTILTGHLRLVTPGFNETIGVPLRRGRWLTEADLAAGAPRRILINETLARRVFGSDDPIGKRLNGWAPDSAKEWREIVGVVADTRAFGREADTQPEIFMPLTQEPSGAWNAFQRTMGIVVKSRPGVSVAPALRAAVKRVDAELPVYDVQTMEDVLSQSFATRRFNTLLLSLLGITGLVLAAIGIYGVIAFFVSQRTHEIGVRVALGATTSNVVGIVVKQALLLAAMGILLGAVLAYWATRVLGNMLFQVDARDPATFALGAGILLLVALGAAWIPARRAARVEPVRALTGAA